jgi:hypothetical protein
LFGRSDSQARWLVVEVLAEEVVQSSWAAKAPRGDDVFRGNYEGAVAELAARGADPTKIIRGEVVAGVRRIAVAPWEGKADAGETGIAIARGRTERAAATVTWASSSPTATTASRKLGPMDLPFAARMGRQKLVTTASPSP